MENSRPLPPVVWIGIVTLGACARLIPHPWNFTPLVAIGLFAGIYAGSAWQAAAATLLSLVLSDLALGFYRGWWVVYAAALVPVLAGRLAANLAKRRPVEKKQVQETANLCSVARRSHSFTVELSSGCPSTRSSSAISGRPCRCSSRSPRC